MLCWTSPQNGRAAICTQLREAIRSKTAAASSNRSGRFVAKAAMVSVWPSLRLVSSQIAGTRASS